MKEDKTYQLLVQRMHEVALLPTQNVGFFTPLYKKIVPKLKFSPWKSATVISVTAAVCLYIMLGAILVRLASLLQFGF